MLVLPSLYHGSPALMISREDFLHGAYAMYFALVKGGPDEANAKKALAMMTNTEMLAGSAKYIAYAPWRKSSLDVIKAGEPWYKDGKTEMMPQMPTAPANTKNYFLVDPFFWADYGTEIGEKWEAMKAGL